MHTSITSFSGTSNIGLFAFVNDSYMLLGKEVPEFHDQELRKVFKVPIHRVTIAGTSLIGVFVAGNNNKIIVPSIIFPEEKIALKKLGINFEIFETRLTCLGNNIALTDHKAIINPQFSDAQQKEIESLLDIKTKKAKIANMETTGIAIVINNKKRKALISNDATDQEINLIEEFLEVAATPSSVNMGTQQVRSGIICNGNGFAIGNASGPAEITTADEALGFLEEDE
jgi:translation initiation factor 6